MFIGCESCVHYVPTNPPFDRNPICKIWGMTLGREYVDRECMDVVRKNNLTLLWFIRW